MSDVKKYILLGGIEPREHWSKRYEGVLRKKVIIPYQNSVAKTFGRALAYAPGELVPSTVLDRLDYAFRQVTIDPDEVNNIVTSALVYLNKRHRTEVLRVLQQAIGVDIRHLLQEPVVNNYMNQKITENVALIRTLDDRHKKGLLDKVQKDLVNKPFDRASITKHLQQQSNVTGYNLRRITRDQTNKMTGNLTQMRHQQIGLTHYMWSTSQDSRVRDEHRPLDGKIFTWDDPPPGGHPGEAIQCRCVALPMLDEEKAKKIKDGAGQEEKKKRKVLNFVLPSKLKMPKKRTTI